MKAMTAEERAREMLSGWIGAVGVDVLAHIPVIAQQQLKEYAIVFLRAHANAALEEAAIEADGRTLSSEACRTNGGCSHIQCLIAREIAAAIRALEEAP